MSNFRLSTQKHPDNYTIVNAGRCPCSTHHLCIRWTSFLATDGTVVSEQVAQFFLIKITIGSSQVHGCADCSHETVEMFFVCTHGLSKKSPQIRSHTSLYHPRTKSKGMKLVSRQSYVTARNLIDYILKFWEDPL